MKKYAAFDGINMEYEQFGTIEEAREWLEEGFLIDGEGYHPDLKGCRIFKLFETVDYEVVDKKSNYKYDYEEEAWPYSTEFDEVWKHKFVPVKEEK
jgi:hypothetical protein